MTLPDHVALLHEIRSPDNPAYRCWSAECVACHWHADTDPVRNTDGSITRLSLDEVRLLAYKHGVEFG